MTPKENPMKFLVDSLQSNHPEVEGYLTQGHRKIHMFPEKGLEGNFIFQL